MKTKKLECKMSQRKRSILKREIGKRDRLSKKKRISIHHLPDKRQSVGTM
jgi:hypothetical protein